MSNTDELDEIIATYIMPAHQHNGIDNREKAKTAILQWVATLIQPKDIPEQVHDTLSGTLEKFGEQHEAMGYNNAVAELRTKLGIE